MTRPDRRFVPTANCTPGRLIRTSFCTPANTIPEADNGGDGDLRFRRPTDLCSRPNVSLRYRASHTKRKLGRFHYIRWRERSVPPKLSENVSWPVNKIAGPLGRLTNAAGTARLFWIPGELANGPRRSKYLRND